MDRRIYQERKVAELLQPHTQTHCNLDAVSDEGSIQSNNLAKLYLKTIPPKTKRRNKSAYLLGYKAVKACHPPSRWYLVRFDET
jgi:hypothetical protein